MKQYFLKAAGATAMLALLVSGSFAQDDNKDKDKDKEKNKHSDEVIIIRPKVDVNTKLSIEIKDGNVTINGKPASEYKDADVTVSRRKQLFIDNNMSDLDVLTAPRTRFRGGTTIYGPEGAPFAFSTTGNRAFLGVGTEKSADGARISTISDESGAEKAGLKRGDVITRINDTKINSPEELTKTIGKFNPDDKITIAYLRDKKEMKTTATLGKRKNAGAFNYKMNMDDMEGFKNFNFDNNYNLMGRHKLGLKAQETEDGKGLKVLDVDDESAAEKAGIKEGDIITSFDGTEVNNIDKLRDLAKPAMEKNSFKVKLQRDGKSQEVEIKIPRNLKSTSL